MLESLPIPLWQIGAAAVALYVLVKLIRQILGGGRGAGTMAQNSCPCGWRGKASRYRPICPSCGRRLPTD